MTKGNDGWRDLLDADEDIIWQGRPVANFIFLPSMIRTMIIGLFFAGFAWFWMDLAAKGGGDFWMFGILHFSVGIGIALSPFVWPRYVRRRTWYTLTNKRGFIATQLPYSGQRLRSYPINADTVIEFAPGEVASVYFGKRTIIQNKRQQVVLDGFESIREGAEVMKLIRSLQADTTATP